MRFEEMKDCYIDTKTGIKWSKENFGLISWQEAIDKAPFGWRLPTIEELPSIIDYTAHNPSTELPGMLPIHYWSSTTYASSDGHTWDVDFLFGDIYYGNKFSTYCTRYVKEG